MASKTYDGGHDSDSNGSGSAPPATVPNARAGNAGDSGGGEQDSDDPDEDDDGQVADLNDHGNGTSGAAASAKKKKRKRTKKKKSASAAAIPKEQSNPPRVRVADLFPSGDYPVGEMSAYDENLSRTTGKETRYLSRMDDDFLREYREAAEVHRQVRQWAQKHLIKPGKTLIEIAEGIEDSVRALVGHPGLEPGDSLKGGMGFPVGLSLNSCAAHYNPNAGNKIVLQNEDVLKVDIGVHVNGRIVDSAWTMAWDPQYDNLLKSVQEATETGVREAGIDARMSHIGAAIQETMESYEVEINGKTYPIKAIRSITGHDIKQFIVHGGKMVPFIKNRDETKMEEGEVFAIETFGSTGRGYLRDDLEVSHYSKNPDAPRVPLRVASAKSVLKTVEENFGTIPFCRRQLDRLGLEKYLYGLNNLVSSGIINSYPPLVDIKGSYTAQYEHTILLRPEGKEIISRGDDY